MHAFFHALSVGLIVLMSQCNAAKTVTSLFPVIPPDELTPVSSALNVLSYILPQSMFGPHNHVSNGQEAENSLCTAIQSTRNGDIPSRVQIDELFYYLSMSNVRDFNICTESDPVKVILEFRRWISRSLEKFSLDDRSLSLGYPTCVSCAETISGGDELFLLKLSPGSKSIQQFLHDYVPPRLLCRECSNKSLSDEPSEREKANSLRVRSSRNISIASGTPKQLYIVVPLGLADPPDIVRNLLFRNTNYTRKAVLSKSIDYKDNSFLAFLFSEKNECTMVTRDKRTMVTGNRFQRPRLIVYEASTDISPCLNLRFSSMDLKDVKPKDNSPIKSRSFRESKKIVTLQEKPIPFSIKKVPTTSREAIRSKKVASSQEMPEFFVESGWAFHSNEVLPDLGQKKIKSIISKNFLILYAEAKGRVWKRGPRCTVRIGAIDQEMGAQNVIDLYIQIIALDVFKGPFFIFDSKFGVATGPVESGAQFEVEAFRLPKLPNPSLYKAINILGYQLSQRPLSRFRKKARKSVFWS
jgi:hypothetical protein